MKQTRVAVTGATGFVGKALGARLSAAGFQHGAVGFRAGDPVRLESVDAVVHLAAIAHRSAVGSQILQRVNVDFAEEVGRAAAAAGSRMIFLSSVKVHGEDAAAPLRESATIAPLDVYAESKARAEARLRAVTGLRLTVLRPPLIYGPGVRANFLALMTAVARGVPLPLASVENRRSFVYAGNLCDAIAKCVESAAAVGRTFFVTDGAPVSTPALCRAVGQALGRPARLFAFPPTLLEAVPAMRKLTRSLVLDDSAIRGELGWRAPFTFGEGLRATAEWYQGR